jgi:ATP-binding cassette, subfamily B, bacterial
VRAVRIGGHDVRDLTLESLRSVVGVVPQDAHLFHDTIRANLLYARPSATEKELAEACQAARIWELISSLPDGLDTIAGDRGYRFSGGEKQRLALARLLLKAPSVVVLAEATAHLDSESEMAIQRALATALAERTSLVIAHRLSTVRAADQILVVDGGQIAERGTHDELLAAGGVYAGLYQTQFAPQAELRSPLLEEVIISCANAGITLSPPAALATKPPRPAQVRPVRARCLPRGPRPASPEHGLGLTPPPARVPCRAQASVSLSVEPRPGAAVRRIADDGEFALLPSSA